MGLLLGYALSVCGDAVGFCLGDHVEVLSGAGDACVEELAREKDVAAMSMARRTWSHWDPWDL